MASQEYVTPGEQLRDIRGTFFAGMPGMTPDTYVEVEVRPCPAAAVKQVSWCSYAHASDTM